METLKNAKSTIAAANKDILGFINAFVDGQSFVETDAFVCSHSELADAIGEGVVSGFATVGGTGVCLFAVNSDVLKGAIGEHNSKKIVRAVNNAVRMQKPLIAVWDTAGARFAEGIAALEGYGAILRAYSIAYGDVPVISIIKGNNLGISSYVSALSDFVVAYEGSVLASASPLVIAAQQNADVKAVGGVDRAAAAGLVTNVVKSDKELKSLLLSVMTVCDGNAQTGDDPNRICKGIKAGVSAASLIKEVFDKDSFIELRGGCAREAITGFASLGDICVGVVATDKSADGGRLTALGCNKITEFINTCSNLATPIVFLTDSVGTARTLDDGALIREMSNLVYTVNTCDIDMFSVVYGNAVGGAYTALVAPCEYRIAWENAVIGAVESETAARLLYADEIKSAKDKEKAVQKLASAYAAENNSALVLARGGYFDNVIAPEHTRMYLLAALLAHVE